MVKKGRGDCVLKKAPVPTCIFTKYMENITGK